MRDALAFLLGGFVNTLLLAAGAIPVALLLAFAVGAARAVRSPGRRGIARVGGAGGVLAGALASYVEFFRGTSLLLQLFWLYYVLPLLGVDLAAATVAVLGIGLNYGAYGSEVVRGALAAVPRGQWEGASALGLTRAQAFRLVVLPQTLPLTIAPLGVLGIQLLKATSLASLITISELSFRAYQLNQVTARTGLIFGAVLLLYFAAAQALSAIVEAIDARVGAWRRAGAART